MFSQVALCTRREILLAESTHFWLSGAVIGLEAEPNKGLSPNVIGQFDGNFRLMRTESYTVAVTAALNHICSQFEK